MQGVSLVGDTGYGSGANGQNKQFFFNDVSRVPWDP